MPILNRKELYEYMFNLRPASRPKTIQGKVSALFTMYQAKHGPSLTINTDWFKNYDEVVESVKDKSDTSKSTYYAAAAFLNNETVRGVKSNDPLHKGMMESNMEYKKQAESGEMSKTQKDNWIEYPKVVEFWNHLFEKAKIILDGEEVLKPVERNELNEFMALTLSAGIFFPPRRSEWVEVKLMNYDPDEDNYLDLPHNRFVLNQHKEVRFFGTQTVEFPEEFRTILVKYIARMKMQSRLTFDERVYLITNTEGNKLTESSLAKMLHRVFGKSVSTTMLRHIYKSHTYGSVPSLKNMREDAEKMGHGLIMSLQYIKR